MNLFLRLLWLSLRPARPRLTIWDTARTPFRVNLMDLDVLKHMNNGRFASIMDLGRIDLMRRSGVLKIMTDRGWYPVVAAQTIGYRRSLTLGQRFEVHTRYLGIAEGSVYVEQTFCVGSDVYAHAVVRAKFLRRSGGVVPGDELEAITGPTPDDRLAPWMLRWAADSRVPAVVPGSQASA